MERNVCNFGILGCANIAIKNAKAICLAKNSKLLAVASRSQDKCSSWCIENNIPQDVRQYGSYQELLDDPEVHAVYIPLPTQLHLEWVKKAAQAKKHIMCEKPAAVSMFELDEMLRECEQNSVQWMDGVMFMHHDRLPILQALLADPTFGQIQRVDSTFCFHGTDTFLKGDIRTKPEGDPLGALGDLGWYCIRIGLVAFNYALPVAVEAKCFQWTAEGVPLDCEGRVYFSGASKHDRVLRFRCGFFSPLRQTVEVSVVGDVDKVVLADDFVLPRSNDVAGWTVDTLTHFPPPSVSLLQTSTFCQQEVRMFEVFADLVISGSRDPFWPQVSRSTQLTMDACLRSMTLGGAEVRLEAAVAPPIPPTVGGGGGGGVSSRGLSLRSRASVTLVYQTEFTANKGNALQACVAAMFGLSQADFDENGGTLPNFIAAAEGYEKAISTWAVRNDHIFKKVNLMPPGRLPDTHKVAPGTLCLVRGTSTRGNHGHVVVGEVGDDGQCISMIHDCHPDGTFLSKDEPTVWIGYFTAVR